MFDNTTYVATVELKSFQKRAVDDISHVLAGALRRDGDDPNRQKKIVLNAPTGSGKTVMISQILHRTARNTVTLVLTPGAGNLGRQTFQSLEKNLAADEKLSVHELTPELLGQEPARGMVMVANWESLTTRNKKTGEYITRNTRDSEQMNLFDFLSKMAVADIDLLIVVDEAHYGASKDATAIKNFLDDVRSTLVGGGGKPFVTLEASATPILGLESGYTYEVLRKDVVNAGLMRKKGILNANVEDVLSASAEEEDLLEVEAVLLEAAWKKHNDLDRLYTKAGSSYSPLLAVQVPNSTLGNAAMERTQEFFATKGVTEENGKLAIFTAGKKSDDLANISAPDSPIEVLLYKQAITTGWDCPRAQVLVGFRHIKSVIFTTQNIGRFSRTTEAKHYPTEFDGLNNFYVYSNLGHLGVDTTSDEKGAKGGDDMFSPQVAQHDRGGFTKYNLPFSVYRRTNQTVLKPSAIGGAVNKVMGDVVDKINLDDEDGQFLVQGDYDNTDLSAWDSVETQKVGVVVSRSQMDGWNTLLQEVLAEVRNAGSHGNDGKIAETVAQKTVAFFSKKSGKNSDKVIDSLSMSSSIAILRKQIAKMLGESLFADLRSLMNTDETTPTPATTRDWRYRGGATLPVETYATQRDASRQVDSRLAKYALYALPAEAEGLERKAFWQEALSTPEKFFEQHILSLVDDETIGLDWIHKNAPFSNGENFSLGLSLNVKESAANFFPDYILVAEKNGKKFPMIVEIKDDQVGSQNARLIAKVKAAQVYSKNTGVPFVVLSHRAGTEGFGVLEVEDGVAKDSVSFSNFVADLNDVEVTEFPATGVVDEEQAPVDMEWLRNLGM